MPDEIKPDWRIVRIVDTHQCDSVWMEHHQIKESGVFYVFDHALAVHCCELTPSYELHAVVSYLLYRSDDVPDEVREEAEEDARRAMYDQDLIYVHCSDVDRLTQKKVEADPPDREEGQSDDAYRMACVDAFRELYQANEPWF